MEATRQTKLLHIICYDSVVNKWICYDMIWWPGVFSIFGSMAEQGLQHMKEGITYVALFIISHIAQP